MTAQPEHKLQVSVAQMLTFGLPPSIWWTANAAGVRVLPGVAGKMKAAGVRRGWPDLQILCPDGKTRYIELKVKATLSPEQRAFRDHAKPLGLWALARSVDDVADAISGWGVEMRVRLT